MSKLTAIKILHTIIWCFFNAVLVYMAYATVTNHIGFYIWIGAALILLEGLVLLLSKMQCPLTIMARRYSNSAKHNFDIYLPVWLAKHTRFLYTTIFILIACLLVYRLTTNET